MRPLMAATALIALTTAAALAQPVPPGANPQTGARPGNVIGTGNSLPVSGRASNITPADTHSVIAPRLPTPPVGENAPPRQFLMIARQALQRGRTGEAQEAMERAESRLLDRVVDPARADQPATGPLITQIRNAREALGHNDVPSAIRILDGVLPQMGG